MIYRKFSEDTDLNSLCKLWKEVFPHDPPHNEPELMLRQKLKVDDLIFVACEHETIVGAVMCGYDGHRGWLYAVAVAEHFRRKSVGQQLIQKAKDELKKLGCIKVNLQIRSDNVEVMQFYTSLGFTEEPRVSMGCFL